MQKNIKQTDMFSGGGEMGKLMRSFDWSKTAVGPVEDWPKSLCTAVSMILNSAFPMLIMWGKDEYTQFYNDAFIEIQGKKHPKALGMSGKIVWDDVWKDVGPLIDNVFAKGETVHMKDLPLTVKRNGYDEPTYFTFSYSSIRDENGKIVGMFNACMETKQQKEVEQAKNEAERASKRLYDLFMNAPAVVAVISGPDLVFEIANPLYRQLVGVKRQIEGKPLMDAIPEIEPSLLKIVNNVAKKGERFVANELPVLLDWDYTGKPYQKYLQLLYEPLFDENNKPDGLMCFAYDVTESVASRKKLEEVARSKDEFIGIASHELKTPVTSIKAYTQLLNLRFNKVQDIRSSELVTKMDGQLNKLTNLINDLLDVTKIEGGKLRFNPAYFNMNELIKEITEEMQRTTSKHTIKLSLTQTKSLYGDRDRIGQVLTNFLTNAIKYSPEADKIIIRSKLKKDTIMISVEDFGIGIPENKKDKVFERFYRVEGKNHETFAGLGLGLYISKEIILRHSGTVTVDSKNEKGSMFSFSLPLKKVEIQQGLDIISEDGIKT